MPIPPGEFIVGRDEKAYVHVADGSVSRRHAKILSLDEGLFVEDIGSSNGTAVRGGLIQGRVAIALGDIVYIGSVPFRVDPEVGGETAQRASPSGNLRPVSRAYVTRETDRIPFAATVEGTVRVSEPEESFPRPVIVPVAVPSQTPRAIIAKSAASPEKAEAVHTFSSATRRISLPPPADPTPVPSIVGGPKRKASAQEGPKSGVSLFLAGLALGLVIGFVAAQFI